MRQCELTIQTDLVWMNDSEYTLKESLTDLLLLPWR